MRAYAQKQPINEYKREAFGLFERMLETIREDVTGILMKSELDLSRAPEPAGFPLDVELPDLPDFLTGHIDPFTGLDNAGNVAPGSEAILGSLAGSPRAAVGPGGAARENPYADLKISRNSPCPCGSGNKYKHCHGAIG